MSESAAEISGMSAMAALDRRITDTQVGAVNRRIDDHEEVCAARWGLLTRIILGTTSAIILALATLFWQSYNRAPDPVMLEIRDLLRKVQP